MIKMNARKWRVLTVLVVVAIICLVTMPEFLAFASVLDAIGVDIFLTLAALQMTAVFATHLKPMFVSSVKRRGPRVRHAMQCLAGAVPGIQRMLEACRFDGNLFLIHLAYRRLPGNLVAGERDLG
jgi:hypothetical protein